jgi:hypothetical protein
LQGAYIQLNILPMDSLVKAEEICQVQELLVALEKKQAVAHA